MKKLLPILALPLALMAEATTSFSTATVAQDIVIVMNSDKKQKINPILKKIINTHNILGKNSAVENKGFPYGTTILPSLISNTVMAQNLSGTTLKNACQFLISFDSQTNKITDIDQASMVSGCIIGYASTLIVGL